MPKAVILLFFCVMRLYIVTKIRKVKKISTNNMFFFLHIHMHKFRHYVYKKEDKRVRAISARPENDLMMMGGGGVQNLVTIPDDTISGWRSR